MYTVLDIRLYAQCESSKSEGHMLVEHTGDPGTATTHLLPHIFAIFCVYLLYTYLLPHIFAISCYTHICLQLCR